MKFILTCLRFVLPGLLCSCGELIVGEPATSPGIADFETAWKTVHDVYPYLQFKGIDWDRIHAVYLPRAQSARGDEMYPVLFDLLSELRDGHVELQTAGGYPVQTYRTPRSLRDRDAYNPLVVRKYSQGELRVAGEGRMEYGILTDNIGYVYFTGFHEGSWINEFSAVLEYLKTTKGLIIDIRDNVGGTDVTSRVVVGRFLTAPLGYPPVYINGVLVPNSGYAIQPLGPFRYDKPIVVLANGRTFSEGEGFTEKMKQIPNVVVVGDTTAGAGGEPHVFTLPSGRAIRVPTKDIRRYDDVRVEWNGVPPDIRVVQTADDARRGIDKQIEYALAWLH
jgi:hypothetical protein